MITVQQLASHLSTFHHPITNAPMATAMKSSDTGGSPDVIRWIDSNGSIGLTSPGQGLPGQGAFKTIGS